MKRYFSFFGILKNSLIKTELKPIKQYSTNNL